MDDDKHESAQWSSGIINLVSTDSEPITEGIKCLGHSCDHVSYGESPGASSLLWCSHAEKTVFYIQECPLGKWRRVEDLSQNKSENMYSCASTRFWRGVGKDNLICVVCHPPVIPESEIEYISNIRLSDMRMAQTWEPGDSENTTSDISFFSCVQCRAFGTHGGVKKCFKRVMFHGKGGKSTQITDTSKTCDEFGLNTNLKN